MSDEPRLGQTGIGTGSTGIPPRPAGAGMRPQRDPAPQGGAVRYEEEPYEGTQNPERTFRTGTTSGSDPANQGTLGELGEQVRHQAQDVADKAGEQYERTKQAVKDKAAEAADEARGFAERQREGIADMIVAACDALDDSARKLDEQGQPTLARYFRFAADGLKDIGVNLRGSDTADLWRGLHDYAQRQPGMAFGGAVAAGFVLSRFLKSRREPGSDWGEASGYGGQSGRAAGYRSASATDTSAMREEVH